MTFLEAAIEVLRDQDEALHFSVIAQRAVERDLLSHVGRDPETAMKSCLTSAVRGNPDSAVLMRSKPGHYMVKPGADLPEAPKAAEPAKPAKPTKKVSAKKASSKKASAAKPAKPAKKASAKSPSGKKASGKKASSKKASTKKSSATREEENTSDAEDLNDDSASENSAAAALSFEAPSGSGLEGPTDIALVMANAMSRLVDERPELKGEFEAMQQTRADSAKDAANDNGGPTIERRTERGRTREDRGETEERGGKRRRRRRKRGRKVEWGVVAQEAVSSPQAVLLDEVARVLAAAGAKSLHVRQLAEQLASVESLGGDIAELERAATAAMLVDISRYGDASRFVARGDARFQMRGARVPSDAAVSEQALYAAVRKQDEVTQLQLAAWLKSLGPRALEAVARMYLEQERFVLLGSTPPGRGVARLWAEDPDGESDEKVQVLIVPAATAVERRLWETDETVGNEPVLLIAMGDVPDNLPDRFRSVGLDEMVRWMIDSGVGVRRVRVDVPALEPSLIESIRGLDA